GVCRRDSGLRRRALGTSGRRGCAPGNDSASRFVRVSREERGELQPIRSPCGCRRRRSAWRGVDSWSAPLLPVGSALGPILAGPRWRFGDGALALLPVPHRASVARAPSLSALVQTVTRLAVDRVGGRLGGHGLLLSPALACRDGGHSDY